MPTGTLLIDLRIPSSSTLKDKRQVIRHLLDSSRVRFQVAAGEVGALELTQRSELAFAAVSAAPDHVTDVLDEVERFVASHPEIEIIQSTREWTEADR